MSTLLHQQQEAFMSDVLMNPSMFSSGHVITAVAMGRWLNVSEIESLLNHEQQNVLTLSTAPPSTPPLSGTLLLFNRSVTRNYKDDGHEWIKKRNSNKVREDHVKLRVGGKFRVSGCYVHSSSTLTFHRRAYHLLSPETGTALYPVTSASKNNRNAPPSLILVHYLDTKVSSANCTALVQKGIDVNPTLYPSGGYPQNAMLAAVLQEPQSRPGQLQHIPENVQSQPQPLPVMSYNSNILDDDGDDDISNPFGAAFDATSHSLDNRTIDFLWDVVVEESSDDVRMHSSSLSELLTPEMIEKMFDSEGVGNIFENGELLNMKQSEMELKTLADTLTTNVQVSGVEVVEVMDTTDHHQHEDEVEIKFGEEAFMPELVDVTPEFVYLDRGNVKVVLSCSFSLRRGAGKLVYPR
jgi:hypothetical protein